MSVKNVQAQVNDDNNNNNDDDERYMYGNHLLVYAGACPSGRSTRQDLQ